MMDAHYNGHRFRVLNVLDKAVREALAIVVGTSISSGYVVRILDQLVAEHGAPRRIRLNNGPEMTARVFTGWCEAKDIQLLYIQPGKPTQNAFIERFNRLFRTEILDAHLFKTLAQVRELAWAWRQSYNEERPHAALGNRPPLEFKRRVQAGNSSTETVRLKGSLQIDHIWFGAVGTSIGSGLSRLSRLRGLIHRFNSNSR